jgi:molybdate transport system substrate-binding protein
VKALAALGAILILAGCGGGGGESGKGELIVYAASSLTDVFQDLDVKAIFNFAGSDELATQIREGAEADVYAAASTKYPDELHEDRLVEQPTVFATNRLVLIVPKDSRARIHTLADLDRKGVKLVVGAEGVPVGDYTREVLEKGGKKRVLDRVVSEEEDVKGVLSKVALGEADAGFVYATDANAAGDDVRSIELPHAIQVAIRYPVAIVAATKRDEQARELVDLLLGDTGRKALQDAGFGLP